jgi:hypothetical protein
VLTARRLLLAGAALAMVVGALAYLRAQGLNEHATCRDWLDAEPSERIDYVEGEAGLDGARAGLVARDVTEACRDFEFVEAESGGQASAPSIKRLVRARASQLP